MQFFHKEMEGYITAEGMFPDLISENGENIFLEFSKDCCMIFPNGSSRFTLQSQGFLPVDLPYRSTVDLPYRSIIALSYRSTIDIR